MKCLLLSCCAVLFSYFSFGQAAINGPSSICIGSIAFLQDSSIGGTWSISDTTIATLSDSGKLKGISAGVVIATYDSAGYAVTKSITVTSLIAPSPITGIYGFCDYFVTDTLQDSTVGGVWTSAPRDIDTIDANGVLSHWGPCSGDCELLDTVTYTQGGCSTSYLVNSRPTGRLYLPDPICLGTVTGAVSTQAGGVWSGGIYGLISISPDGIFASSVVGSTSFVYTKDGCDAGVAVNVITGIADNVVINEADTFCNGPDFHLDFCHTADTYTIGSSYGDGTSDTNYIYGYPYSADIFHVYTFPGTYSVTQVMNDGYYSSSVAFSYEYTYCRTLPIKIYDDNNMNCIFDTGDNFNYLPVTIEVDSNGVAVDTLSGTSGIYYPSTGPVGTIYSFHILTTPGGMAESCPTSGYLYDTISATANIYAAKYFGMNCTGSTGFDLSEYTSSICGRHTANHTILINNDYCTTETPVVTMNFSPKYSFVSSVPSPTSIVGNVITWDLGATFSYSPLPPIINAGFAINTSAATWLTPGDTVMSTYIVTPTAGDIDTTNNSSTVIDTVKTGYDPNEMAVTPAGIIPSGTKLLYTVNFENTGNAEAVNISVMDTLSPNVDVRSLRIVAASAVMNTVILNSGSYTIVKFDFPAINLLDSSYHNQCNGMVQFTINVKDSLANGTTIFNHAGIFFDDNPVVMTDTVEDMIGTIPTGIQTIKNNHIVDVYPNPATTSLTVKSTGIINSIAITNLLGREVYTNTYNTTLAQIDITALAAGVYFIKVNGTDVRKFVKE